MEFVDPLAGIIRDLALSAGGFAAGFAAGMWCRVRRRT